MATPRKRRRNRSNDRRSRRHESHDLAQLEAEQKGAAPVPEHPLIPSGTPELIETDAALATLLDEVRAAGVFAYDTEFIGEETYHPHLCLIQIATAERIALVDPLAGVDLLPIWEVIADPATKVLVHAGSQDLEPVVRHTQSGPTHIFDTQIAAGFVRLPYPLGLRHLVEVLLGHEIGKGLTFTKWDARPLSRVHMRYAADDVRYLPALHAELQARLERFGHTEWLDAECRSLERPELYEFDGERRAARIIGTRKFRPREQAILRELVEWRDERARADNVPPRALLKDEVLLRLAKDPAKSVEKLGDIKHMPWPVAEKYGTHILDAIEAGRAQDPKAAGFSSTLVESTEQRTEIDALWSLIATFCYGRGIDPGLATNRRDVAQYVLGRAKTLPPPERLVTGWRGELLAPILEGFERTAGGRLVFDWAGGGPYVRVSSEAGAQTTNGRPAG